MARVSGNEVPTGAYLPIAKAPLVPAKLSAMGMLNPSGLKFRGLTLTPKSPGDWGQYFGSAWDATYVTNQMTYAAQLGANLVRSYGCPWQVLAGSVSRATYLANWTTWLNAAQHQGLYVYVTLLEPSQLAQVGGVYASYATVPVATVAAELAALAALLDTYPNVIGIDLMNESPDKLGYNTLWPTWLQTIVPAVKAVTTLPVTCDILAGNATVFGTGHYETQLLAGFAPYTPDFLDYHPYYGSGNTAVPADVAVARANYPQFPIIIGEICSVQSANSATNAALINAVRALSELPYVAGATIFPSNDYGAGDTGNSQALFDTSAGLTLTWAERTASTYPFRTLPRRRYYLGPQSLPLAVDASAATLTTSLASVTGAASSVSTADFDLEPALDGQWRLTAEVSGLTAGDVVELAATDPSASNAIQGSATATAPSTTVADSSSSPKTGYPGTVVAGTGGAVPSLGAGEFGNALTFASLATPAYVNFGTALPISGSAFTLEAWIKRGATGSAQTIAGRWNSTLSTEQVTLYIASNDMLSAAVENNSATRVFPTDTVALTDTASWHHVAVSWDGTTVRLFKDGALVASSALSGTIRAQDGATPFMIGAQQNGAGFNQGWVGGIDEVRVSNVARYTAAFTAPTSAFTADGNTVALYHLDDLYTPAILRVSTPWLYAQPGPAYTQAQVQNQTGARGKVESLVLEARYG